MTAQEAKARYWQTLGSSSRVFDRALKDVIIEVDAIDTEWMKNTSVVRMREREDRHVFNISTTFYFKFVDRGTRYITPRQILSKWQKLPEVRTQVQKVLSAYETWQALEKLTGIKNPKAQI